MWNTNLGVAVVLQGRWLGQINYELACRSVVYLQVCLDSSRYEVLDARPWIKEVQFNHHGLLRIPSQQFLPAEHLPILESWAHCTGITWPWKRKPGVPCCINGTSLHTNVLHTYPRYGSRCTYFVQWIHFHLGSPIRMTKSWCCQWRREEISFRIATIGILNWISNQGWFTRHSRMVIFLPCSAWTKTGVCSVRLLVLAPGSGLKEVGED